MEHACLERLAPKVDARAHGLADARCRAARKVRVVGDHVALDGRALGVVHRVLAPIGSSALLAREAGRRLVAIDRLIGRGALRIEAARTAAAVCTTLAARATRNGRDRRARVHNQVEAAARRAQAHIGRIVAERVQRAREPPVPGEAAAKGGAVRDVRCWHLVAWQARLVRELGEAQSHQGKDPSHKRSEKAREKF